MSTEDTSAQTPTDNASTAEHRHAILPPPSTESVRDQKTDLASLAKSITHEPFSPDLKTVAPLLIKQSKPRLSNKRPARGASSQHRRK